MSPRAIACAAAGPGGVPRPGAALRRSLRIPGVAVLAAASCALPGRALACASKDTEGTDSGDAKLDAARKRFLEHPPTAPGELKWLKAVQELRENEEWYLKRCMAQEKKGDAVALADAYKRWKEYREELDLYERDPRRWLRRHGRYRGLEEHLTLAEKAREYWPLYAWIPAFFTSAALLAFPRRES